MNTKTATITLEIATKMYQGTDESLRDFALHHFPDLGKSIMERVKSFEGACIVLGIDPTDTRFTNDALNAHEIARRKVEVIVKALNEGWNPNWDDSNERKYYPWFKMSSSGVGFSYYDFDRDFTLSSVGFRLVFKSSELAIYAGKQFTEIYKAMLTL